jgi:CHAD domain-containing protein
MAKRRPGAVAAGAAVATGGAIAAGMVVHDVVSERGERKRARRFRLEADETVRAGITRIAQGQLDFAIALIDGRKALKRLRAVLRLCRPWLGKERFRQENTILRDAGRALSDTRDAQVLVETLDGLREQLGSELPEDTWSSFRQALAADAQERTERDGGGGRSNVVIALAGVSERVEVWPLPEDAGPEALGTGLSRVYSNARQAERSAQRRPTNEHVHELRKRTKDVWHSGQLLGSVRPKRTRRLRRRAHRLSDVLGEHHDQSVLRERADSTPETFGPGELELLHAATDRRLRALEHEGLARAAKLYRRKPRKLVRRLLPT